MQFQRVNRTDAEKAYIVVKNGFATTLTTGYVACFDYKNDTTGVTVSQPQTGTNSAWYAIAGVAAENIAAAGYGRLQVYGICPTYCSVENSANADVEIGQPVGIKTGQWYLVSNGLSDGKSGAAFVPAQRLVQGILSNSNVFIRCL
jgi:hypothetical protein